MDITLTQAITFILDHNHRVNDMSNPQPEKEFVAVKIDGKELEKLTDLGAVDFVVFHGVENDSNTVIVMGQKSDGSFVKEAGGDFKILERWNKFGPTVEKVDDDINELMKLFI